MLGMTGDKCEGNDMLGVNCGEKLTGIFLTVLQEKECRGR